MDRIPYRSVNTCKGAGIPRPFDPDRAWKVDRRLPVRILHGSELRPYLICPLRFSDS